MIHHLDGAILGLAWILPFAGLLLSIAVLPLATPHLWHTRFGAVAALWSACFLLPHAMLYGAAPTATALLHTASFEYLPFLILLFTLFVVAGGIRISGNLIGTPGTNLALLAIGTALASVLGTTGASMLLVRPVIRANQDRRSKIHVFVFFIFLVGNVGGGLTPLGDPPLFLGFLQGVPFGWTVTHMAGPTAFAAAVLLGLFFILDLVLWRRDPVEVPSRMPRRVMVAGGHNFLILGGVVATVLFSGTVRTGISIPIAGDAMELESLLRDLVLLGLAFLSWRTTRSDVRVENAFTWGPIREVAILFAGIFVTMIPALAILKAGPAGAMAPLLTFVSSPAGPVDPAYFWLTGLLSSVLDNAPTYLVFFNLAGGDPALLTGPLATTLTAISAGAVFMGANTYIGNAPNFMIKSICEEQGVSMPGFFGYMAWSGAILLPLFALMTLLFFRT